ncbi:exodeoxyribonuclease 7 large subunit [Luteitalea sp. TBR-22]|uniref:exodeoxyribonuclease VII large subunit n=1 Tax=Luteitalea sp. TBR-22 TaxID=2802971 RepID=UPI001AFB3F4C|nr:exodeoxyribonuclease VII large subunit [Luteitalea sp. TBR-22]BCS32730.1 exodeoxyribonuclease 7 large subunit [Luteitalea sp. TBR-22]
MSSLFDLPFEDAPLDPEDLRPVEPARLDKPPVAPVGAERRRDEEPVVAPRPREATAAPARPVVLTVSAITQAVRGTLERDFPRVWVEGELTDCSEKGGHLYFTLKDASARLGAIMWRTDAARLRFRLANGMQVIARGRISVYVPTGRYQLYVDGIEPKGAGALQVAFEQLKKRLQAEGLFDPARKRPLPLLPRAIGVVTSLEGAALRDVIRVLRTRHAPADIVIAPTRVQGDEAGPEIARAIARIARVPNVDVLIVGRGGGSAEDLKAFNEEVVARAIAACKVPVISAVGHEVDTTIADLVADVRAATPSHAAELVVGQASAFRERIATARRQMSLLLRSRLDRQRARLLHVEQRPAFARFRDRVFDRDRQRLDLHERLVGALRLRLRDDRRRLDDLARRLDEQHPQRQLTARLRRLSALDERLAVSMRQRQAQAAAALQTHRDRLARVGLEARVAQACRRVDAHLARARQAVELSWHRGDRQLTALAGQLHALSPLGTLARGYAICWNASGTAIVRSVEQVRPGEQVQVQLPDGRLQCEVDGAAPGLPPRP